MQRSAGAMHRIVVMGVAGSGKSTLAGEVARALACPLIEGDDHHLETSRAKMRRGLALEDADREPWLDVLGAMLAQSVGNVVLTCSALRRRYRDRLRAQVPGLRFVHLEIEPGLATERVASRAGHFFPPSVVASQFDALESPSGEAGVLVLAAALAPAAQRDAVLQWLDRPALQNPPV